MQPHNYFIYSKKDFTEKSAAQTRMFCYAKALAAESGRVFLASCTTGPIEKRTIKKVESRIGILQNKKRAKTPWEKLRFIRRMYYFSKHLEGETVFIFYPTTFFLFEFMALFYLKGIKKRKVFIELNEVRRHSPQISGSYNLLRPFFSIKKWVFLRLTDMSTNLLRYYNGLICISTAIEEYGRKHNSVTIRIPILTDSRAKHKSSGKSFFVENRFNIGFAGSIYHTKENFDEFLDIIERLVSSQYRVTFNICGSITKRYRNRFLKRCDKSDSLCFYGKLDVEDLSAFLRQQHLLVIPRGFTLQNHYGFSTKLSDYLSHGKMVLVTDISDNKLFIHDGLNGFMVPPNDPEAMLDKLKYIINNFDSLHKNIEKEAMKTAQESFDYQNHSSKLIRFLREH